MAGELTQIAVVPGRLGAFEDARSVGGAVPADAEPVAVGRLGPHPRMQALIDQRMGPPVERLVQEDGGAGVCKPAAHMPLLSVEEFIGRVNLARGREAPVRRQEPRGSACEHICRALRPGGMGALTSDPGSGREPPHPVMRSTVRSMPSSLIGLALSRLRPQWCCVGRWCPRVGPRPTEVITRSGLSEPIPPQAVRPDRSVFRPDLGSLAVRMPAASSGAKLMLRPVELVDAVRARSPTNIGGHHECF